MKIHQSSANLLPHNPNHAHIQPSTLASLNEDQLKSMKSLLSLAHVTDHFVPEPRTPVFSQQKIVHSVVPTLTDFEPQSMLTESQIDFSHTGLKGQFYGTDANPSIEDSFFKLIIPATAEKVPSHKKEDLVSRRTSLSEQKLSKKESNVSSRNEIMELLEYSRKNKLRKGNDSNIGIFGTFKISELRKYLNEY